jgi:exonuclease III
MTANIPGLRNNVSHVVNKQWDIAAFQESGISCKNIGQMSARCTDSGVKLLHGPITENAYGGVAILSKTRKVKEWRKGEERFVKNNRWQMVEIYISQNKKHYFGKSIWAQWG